MIRSFSDKRTAAVFAGKPVRRMAPELQRQCREKLVEIDAAPNLEVLRAKPSLRLERLRGERRGQWSVRVNDQRRICFVWTDGDAHDVAIVDYHN